MRWLDFDKYFAHLTPGMGDKLPICSQILNKRQTELRQHVYWSMIYL